MIVKNSLQLKELSNELINDNDFRCRIYKERLRNYLKKIKLYKIFQNMNEISFFKKLY